MLGLTTTPSEDTGKDAADFITKLVKVKNADTNEEILKKVARSKEGGKFNKLVNGDYSDFRDKAEADFWACKILGRYTKDHMGIDTILRGFPIGQRDKWKRRPNYGLETIAAALNPPKGGR